MRTGVIHPNILTDYASTRLALAFILLRFLDLLRSILQFLCCFLWNHEKVDFTYSHVDVKVITETDDE